MRRMIRHRYPAHGILGEEFGPENTGAEFVWVLDPIDGTVRLPPPPLFLERSSHCSITASRCWGRLISRSCDNWSSATASAQRSTAGPSACARRRISPRRHCFAAACFRPRVTRTERRFAALGLRVKQLRTWGDCFGYLLVATGWADIMCDPIMNAWDIAALIPVVRGAGGIITDWQGRDPVNATSIVAAIPGLHAQVIAALNP